MNAVHIVATTDQQFLDQDFSLDIKCDLDLWHYLFRITYILELQNFNIAISIPDRLKINMTLIFSNYLVCTNVTNPV